MPFTPSQVSETLGIPSSTIRRWASKFSSYISEQPGKKRSYTIADIDVFRQIRTLSGQGLSLDQIANSLQVVEPEQVRGAELLALDDFANALQGLFDQNAGLQQQIDDQQEQINLLMSWLALPWYQRIGKQAPTAQTVADVVR